MNRGEFNAMKERLAEQDKLIRSLLDRVEALEARPALPVNRIRAGEKPNA